MQLNPTVGILYAQTGYTSRVAHEASTAPQTALAASRAIATEMAKLEQHQIQAPEAAVEARIADGGNNKEGGRKFQQQKNATKQEDDVLSEQEATPSEDPLVGNLLNVRV